MDNILKTLDKMQMGDIKNKIKQTKVFSNELDVLESEELKKEIKRFADKHVAFSSNKKELQKILMKKYISFLQKNSESVFENLYLQRKELEKIERIALFVRYNKKLNKSELIKEIKNFDNITLVELIIGEYVTQSLLAFYLKESNYNKSVELLKIGVLLSTINVIKAIKYDYLNCNIACFNKNNKPKKIFINKKIHSSINGLCFVDKNQITVENIANYLYENCFEYGKELTLSQIIDSDIPAYACSVVLNMGYTHDEYTKLILGENYSYYISNRAIDLKEVYISGIKSDVFWYRKVLMPRSGVLLLIEGDDSIESILLKEVYKFNMNHFVAITKYKDGKEVSNVFALDEKSFINNIYWIYKKETKFRVIDYIVHFLDSMNMSEEFDEMKYEVISPTYWKYRNCGYKSENDKIDHRGIVVKREFEIEIAPFIRKIQGEASSEAKSLAKKLGVILEDGYTIVRSHTRHYNNVK